jgi:predicted Zn-dependent protease
MAISEDREAPDGYSYLAQAYGRLGEVPLAELATADMHYYSGNLQQARIFAARAKQALKPGSPAWLRADDIINSKG